jgi:urease accessory protein
MSSKLVRWCIALISIASCGIAQAHPGHVSGAASSLLAGLAHPLLGIDHLLVMVAVGAWAFQLGGRAIWLVPASFVALMSVAAGAGMAGVAMAHVEIGIAGSLLVLGLLVALSIRVQPALAAAVVALFAMFHGTAHGIEMPVLGMAWQYGIGFIVTTAALHGLGLWLARCVDRRWLRVTGAIAAIGGVWMVAAS